MFVGVPQTMCGALENKNQSTSQAGERMRDSRSNRMHASYLLPALIYLLHTLGLNGCEVDGINVLVSTETQ